MHKYGIFGLLLTACTGSTTLPTVQQQPAVTPAPLASQAAVSYIVDLSRAAQHLVDITATAEVSSQLDTQTWMIPTWSPGSYLIRDYAKHVEAFRAVDETGQPREVSRTALNRWAVEAAGAEQITVHYTVYANDPSVRTAWVHRDGAVLVGPSLFVSPLAARSKPHALVLQGLPNTWTGVATALKAAPDGGSYAYMARTFDALLDSPLLAGALAIGEFERVGVPHTYARLGGDAVWPDEKAMRDVARITDIVTDFWGIIPYDRYTFLQVVTDSYGGLEHRDSSLLFSRPRATDDDEHWHRWRGLISHELFHAWNVKRLRPAALLPYDYEKPQLTSSLWIAEGLTSYYDELLLVRAGLASQETYLKELSETLTHVMARVGGGVQPLSSASREAWIKYYQPDEDSPNATVSYYKKGAIVGWLIDAEIRRATRGRYSLDDAMRSAWAQYGEQGYTEAGFRAVLSQVAGIDLSVHLASWVDGRAPLDLDGALSWFGLQLAADKEMGEPWLGLSLTGERIAEVRRGGPAFKAGLSVGDAVLAIERRRLQPDRLTQMLDVYEVGQEVSILVDHEGIVRTVPVVIEGRPRLAWNLQIDAHAGRAAALRREAWLGTHE